MKINALKFFILGIFTLISVAGQAQKFGYINSQALLSEIPEVKAADANLQAFQSQLEKKGQQMVQELETKYRELQKKEQSGEISPNPGLIQKISSAYLRKTEQGVRSCQPAGGREEQKTLLYPKHSVFPAVQVQKHD